MPIRQRAGNWQADVRLPNGQRIRKQFPTKAAAAAFERTIRPTQRRGAQSQPSSRRTQTKATRKIAPPARPSPNTTAISTRKTSQRPPSPRSATSGGTYGPPPAGRTTVH